MTNESKDAVDDVFKLDSTEIQTVNEENQPNHNESQEKSVILTKRMKNFVFNKIQIHAIQVCSILLFYAMFFHQYFSYLTSGQYSMHISSRRRNRYFE